MHTSGHTLDVQDKLHMCRTHFGCAGHTSYVQDTLQMESEVQVKLMESGSCVILNNSLLGVPKFIKGSTVFSKDSFTLYLLHGLFEF